MYPRRTHRYLPRFLILLSAACAMPLLAYAAPRVPGDAAGRGKDKVSVPPARLVTGDPAQINAVVAGTPPTAIFAISPVPTKMDLYPPGTTLTGKCSGLPANTACTAPGQGPAQGTCPVGQTCVANTLNADAGNFRAFFDVTIKDWDPNGDGVPGMHQLTVKVDADGYRGLNAVPSNPGVDLVPPSLIPCTSNADCAVLFGENWAECLVGMGFCQAGYVAFPGFLGPANNFCSVAASGGCPSGLTDTSSDFFRWILVHSRSNRPDRHILYYVGSLVLDIPAAMCSGLPLRTVCTGWPGQGSCPGGQTCNLLKGTYTVDLSSETEFGDVDATVFLEKQLNGFVVNIVPRPCTGPADCPDDGLFCDGTEFCNTSDLCTHSGFFCPPNQRCDEDTHQCLNFGACCQKVEAVTVCSPTIEPLCVGAGGVFLGAGSTCPTQFVGVPIPEGDGSVFIHHIEVPEDCPAPGPAQVAAVCPPSGPYTDPWVSEESGSMCHNFGSPDTDPIPAGFFDPGSDPFMATVCLRGVPLGIPQYGDADTLISRSADPFDRCDLPSVTPSTVNIEIVALSLESVNPIVVTYNGGQNPETWNVTVDLSPGGLPPSTPPGTLRATKSHCNGGTYTSRLYVQPRFTFTKVGNPSEVRVLDTGMTSTPPVELVQSDPHPWVSDIDPFLGAMVDRCSDFHANISDNNLLLECDCNGNSRRDLCDIEDGVSLDCNANGVPDSCDLSNGTSQDVNGNGVPDECERRGACCDKRIADPALRCLDDVLAADCIIDDPIQVSWTKLTRCADLDCAEHTGACCDKRIANGALRCRDLVPESQCTIDDPTQVSWTKGTLCQDLGAPCTEHTGACCDKRIADDTLRCRDDVPESGCVIDDPNQVSWYKFTRCADVTCLEHTGACCEFLTGHCTTKVQADCLALPVNLQAHWSVKATCESVHCTPDFGACCDHDTFGGCTQTYSIDCQGGKLRWFKLESCATVEDRGDCVHDAIPTVSEWGLVVLTLLLLIGAKIYFRGSRPALA